MQFLARLFALCLALMASPMVYSTGTHEVDWVLPNWARNKLPNGVPREIADFLEYLKEPEVFQRLGVKMPRGILMYGPPGTGKTLLARSIAEATNTPFFYATATSFKRPLVGLGAKEIRDLFEKAKKAAQKGGRAIIFIDELDAIGNRDLIMQSGHDEELLELLAQMDGFEKNPGIIIFGATNKIDRLDKALTRPGRFDYKVEVPLPTAQGREAILRHYLRKIAFVNEDRESLIAEFALKTAGCSGAQLEALINTAAMIAARERARAVTVKHLYQALKQLHTL